MTGQVVIDTLGELYQNGIGFDGSLAFNIFSGATTSGATLMPLVSDYSAWKYRTKVKVQNPPEIEAQAKFTLSHQTGMAQDFSDLRFSTLQGQEIPYWIESQVNGSEAIVWLKLPAYATRVYAYWGNTSAVSESSVTTETLDNTPTLSLMVVDFNPTYGGYTWNCMKHVMQVVVANPPTLTSQVELNLSHQTGMKSDFSDVRFATIHGQTIEYWKESYVAGTSAKFGLQLPAGTERFKAYFGNSAAVDTGDSEIFGTLNVITLTVNPVGYNTGYYLYDWSTFEHQSTVVVENPPESHMPVQLSLTKADYSILSSGADLRFCDVNGNYLPYWIESDDGTTILVWTMVPKDATRFFLRSGYTSATNESSAFDSVLYFNGGEDYVNCGNDISIQMGNIFSVSFWVKIDDLADHHYLVSKGNGLGRGSGWAITYYAGTMKLYFDVHHIDGTRNSVSIPYPNDNDYHYVEATFDNGIMYLSIDGSGYTSDKGNLVFDDTSHDLLISKPSSTSWYALTGTISDVKLWNMGELVAYYPMRGNTGSVIYDYVGNNNGTIYNATWVDGILPLDETEPTLYVLPEGYSPEYVLDISGFTKKAQITISNPHTSRYPVRLTVPYAASMQADFSDLEFVDALGRRCPHWVETYTASTEAYVWVLTPAGLSSIDMYYGATGWANTSNGEQVFPLGFDDFNLPLDAEPSGQWVVEKYKTAHSADWVRANGTGGMVISKGADRGAIFLKTRHKFKCGVVANYRTERSISNYGAYMFGPGEPAGEYGGSGNEWFGTLGFNTIMLRVRDATSATQNQIARITESGSLLYSWVNGEPIYDALDTPKTHKMIWNETELRLFSNGLYSDHYESGTAIKDSYFAFMQGYYSVTGTITIDWIGFHEYVATEPSLSIGAEESVGGTSYTESATLSMLGSNSSSGQLSVKESSQVQNNSALNVLGLISLNELVSVLGNGAVNAGSRLDFNNAVQTTQIHQTIINSLVDAILEVQVTSTQGLLLSLGSAYKEMTELQNLGMPSLSSQVDYNILFNQITRAIASVSSKATIQEGASVNATSLVSGDTKQSFIESTLVNSNMVPDINNQIGINITISTNHNQSMTIRLNKNLTELVETIHNSSPEIFIHYILEATLIHLQNNPQVAVPEIIRLLLSLAHSSYYTVEIETHNSYYVVEVETRNKYNIELSLKGGGNE